MCRQPERWRSKRKGQGVQEEGARIAMTSTQAATMFGTSRGKSGRPREGEQEDLGGSTEERGCRLQCPSSPSKPFAFKVTHVAPSSLCVLKRRKLSRCMATTARTPCDPQISHVNKEATVTATTNTRRQQRVNNKRNRRQRTQPQHP